MLNSSTCVTDTSDSNERQVYQEIKIPAGTVFEVHDYDIHAKVKMPELERDMPVMIYYYPEGNIYDAENKPMQIKHCYSRTPEGAIESLKSDAYFIYKYFFLYVKNDSMLTEEMFKRKMALLSYLEG